MSLKNINFYEFAGLPGSGKSSISKKIIDSHHLNSHLTLKIFFSLKLRFLLSILVSPIIIFKFLKVFKALLLLKKHKYSPKQSARIFLSILFTIGDYFLKLSISRAESLFKGKKSLLDEGFIQCGLSIWMRSPPEIREKIWEVFMSYIPKRTLFIIVDIDNNSALERCMNRNKGVPRVFESRIWASEKSNYIADQFSKLSILLRNIKFKNNSNIISISSLEDMDSSSKKIIASISKSTDIKNLLIN